MIHKILITGGSGILGSQLVKSCIENNIEYYAPTHDEYDLLDEYDECTVFQNFSPTIIIHAAAFVDTFGCENNPYKALEVNTLGTLHLVRRYMSSPVKFVYISTEYVFGGSKGNYDITDRLDPINVYGKTKAAAEYIVSVMPSYQIIRVPFIRKEYENVFTDQFCSRYFIDEVAHKIIDNAMFNGDNIVHISTERRSLFNIQHTRHPNIKPIQMTDEQKKILPVDTSLKNTNKF